MEQQLHQFIQKNHLFRKEEKLLLALSGGVDSMVMMNLLHQLKYDITVAHCNFQLRSKESDGDADFVESICQSLKIPCFVKSFDTNSFADKNRISIQMAARELRYQWFEELCSHHGYSKICTAHHADDNAETILINLIRGTGINGLTGIPLVNQRIVRPLLHFTKKELVQYATNHQVKWRDDSSNLKDDYQRNLIRLQVLPVLQKINPSIIETLLNFSSVMEETEKLATENIVQYLSSRVERLNSVDIFNTTDLDQHPAKKTILYFFLSPYGFRSGQMEMITRSLSHQPGKIFYSSTHKAVMDRDRILVSALTDQIENIPELIDNNVQCYSFDDGDLHLNIIETQSALMMENKNPDIAYLDAGLIKFPLTCRHWEKGDYFYPLGMDHQRKLSDYFIDRKIAITDKEKIRLLINEKDIIWIVSERIDQRYRLTENTKTVLELIWKPNGQ